MFQPDPDVHRLLSVERTERLRADIDRERLRRRATLRPKSLGTFHLLRQRRQQHSTACGGTS